MGQIKRECHIAYQLGNSQIEVRSNLFWIIQDPNKVNIPCGEIEFLWESQFMNMDIVNLLATCLYSYWYRN